MYARPDFQDERLHERAEVLTKLFSGVVSSQSAAETLATISLRPNETLELTWTAITFAARTFPEQQEKLVDLLSDISRLPPAEDKDGKLMTRYGGQIWQDMPRLERDFNDEWNGFYVPDDTDPERDKAAIVFININTFAARLKLTGLTPFEGFDKFGLWTLRDGLEEQPIDEDIPSDVFVPAAAVWISVVGPQMYQWNREFRGGHGGALWNGRHGFCKQRWCLWRRRFAEFAESEELSNEVGRTAACAVARMEEIEAEAGD